MCDCDTCQRLNARYEQAADEKEAAGCGEEPDCECPPCTAERNLWFMLAHAHDDVPRYDIEQFERVLAASGEDYIPF